MNRLAKLARSLQFNTFIGSCGVRRLAVIVAALTLALLATTAHAAVHIEVVKPPAFVVLDVGPVEQLMTQSAAKREALVNLLAKKVSAAAQSNPERILAIKPGDFSLDFDRLPENTQRSLTKSLRNQAASTYQSTVRTILLQVLDRVRQQYANTGLSVHGLPVESRDGAATNVAFAALIEQLDAIVSSRTIIVGGGAETEPSAVRRSLNNALQLAGSRPVYYQCNGQWHCLTFNHAPGAIDVYPEVNFESRRSHAQGSPADSFANAGGAAASGAGNAMKSDSSPDGAGGAAGGGGGGGSDSSSGGGGGGGGGGGSGGGGSGSGGAGPLGPPNNSSSGSSETRLWVLQQTSASVKGIYSSYGAKDCYSIYQGEIDPDNDGEFTHHALLEQALIREVPPDFTGPVSLDWEGLGMENLGPEVDQATFEHQMGEFIKVLQKAKQVRPNAKFGFYGLPHALPSGEFEYWKAWTLRLQPLFDESQCILPSIYRFYQDDQPYWSAEINKQWLQRKVKLALIAANGKPVYPVMWHRFHDSNANLAFQLIPAADFKTHVKAAFQTIYQDKRADGVIWWGADQYMWWIATNYPNGDVQYPNGPQFVEVFANEMAPGETPAQHFSRIHKRMIRRLSDVVTQFYP